MKSIHNNPHAFSLQSLINSLMVYCLLTTVTAQAQNHFVNQFQPTNIVGAQGDSYNVVATSDGGFITLNKIDIASGNPGPHQVLTKMDANGTVLWSKDLVNVFPNSNSQFDHYSHLCLVGEGDIALAGIVRKSPASQGAPAYLALLVSRLSPTGAPIWSKAYDVDSDDPAAYHMSATEQGHLLVSGTFREGPCQSSSSQDTYLDILLKLDGNGQLTWRRTETLSCDTDEGVGDLILPASNGSYIYISHLYKDTNTGMSRLNISSYSPQGNLNWQKRFVGPQTDDYWLDYFEPYDIIETTNGEFVVASNYSQDGGFSKLALLRFNAQGNMVWQRSFDIDERVQIELTSNDFIVMATQSGKVYNLTSWGTLLQGHTYPNVSLTGITKASNGDIVFNGKHNGNEEVDAFFTLIRGNDMGYNSCAEANELPPEEELEWSFYDSEEMYTEAIPVIGLDVTTPDFDINGGWRCITAPARKAATSISIQEPKLYPNPSHGKSVLELDAFTHSVKMVRVFTIQGQLISQQEMPSSQHSLDLQVGSPGLYLIQIELAGETFQKKWMVK
ncbi:MAG: T9SS type A sorting domain-containing protein [Bacteroidota bacterium]